MALNKSKKSREFKETILNTPICYRCGYVDLNFDCDLETDQIVVCPDCREHTLMRIETMMDFMNERHLNEETKELELHELYDEELEREWE